MQRCSCVSASTMETHHAERPHLCLEAASVYRLALQSWIKPQTPPCGCWRWPWGATRQHLFCLLGWLYNCSGSSISQISKTLFTFGFKMHFGNRNTSPCTPVSIKLTTCVQILLLPTSSPHVVTVSVWQVPDLFVLRTIVHSQAIPAAEQDRAICNLQWLWALCQQTSHVLHQWHIFLAGACL